MRTLRTLGILAAVLLSATVAQAQEVVTATLVSIAQQQRDPQTFTTPEVPRAQLPSVEGEFLRVRLTMPLADVRNEAHTFSAYLYEFIPGTGWKFVTGGSMQGGTYLDENGQQIYPQILFHPSQLNAATTSVRAEFSWSQRLRIGVVAETIRP